MKKILVSVLAGLIALVAVTATPAQAGSTISTTLNTHPCYGSVTYGSNSASATTTFGRGNSYIYTHATVYCYMGNSIVAAGVASASATSGGTTATAYRESGYASCVICGGRGHHENSYTNSQGFYIWKGDTSIGTVS